MSIVTTHIELDAEPPEAEKPARSMWNKWTIGGVAVAGLLVFYVFLDAFIPRPATPPTAIPAAAEYRLLVEVTEGAQAIRAVYYEDGSGAMLPDQAASMTDVAAVVVTVVSTVDGEAGCRITVNDVVIDDERASGGGQALCVWIAGGGPVFAAEPELLSRT